MRFQWNEQTFTWLYEASDYTGYDRELAALLRPHLAGCRTLCDIGCGMALADMELAADLDQILCVDLSPEVVGYVSDAAEHRGIGNLRVVCTDGMNTDEMKRFLQEMNPEKRPEADAVMALFHGDIEQVGETYLSYAAKKLILVVHGSAHGSTGPEKYRVRKCCDIDHTSAWLEERGIAYEMQEAALEFGQPHRSLEDAIVYTKTFTVGAPEEELRSYVMEHAEETGREDFPLYTPKLRKFGIFIINQ